MKSFVLLFSLCFLFLSAFSQKPAVDTLSFEVKDITFEVNKFTTTKYNNDLNTFAKYLIRNQEAVVELGGYTDTQGSVKYNKILAEKRADFVRNYLIKKGANPKQIVAKIYGKQNLISKTSKYNRRVEIKIIKEGNDKLIVKQIEVPKESRITKTTISKSVVSTVNKKTNLSVSKTKKSSRNKKKEVQDEYITSKELGTFSDVLNHQEYITSKELSTFTEILMCQKQLSHREGDKDYAFDCPETINDYPSMDSMSVRDKIVEFSKRFLKLRYRWGGTTPQGFDCSGFTRYIYGNTTGIELPRTSSEQASIGETVEIVDAKPGDLVFFGYKKKGVYRTKHTGMVVANDNGKLTMIHSSRKGIRVEDDILASDYYSKKFLFIKRVMN